MAHTHGVADDDLHFIIDPTTREITNELKKIKLMQGDHASEVFTFEIPRYVDGHDMSLCNKIAVHYINVGQSASNPDVHIVTDATIDDSEEKITFTWIIRSPATKYPGTLSFLIKFSCVGDDGVILYQWNTDIFKGITVSTGMDNGETLYEEYPDILEKWKNDVLESIPPHTVTRIESLDFNNMVILRDLESGSYILHGAFKPYSGSDNILTFGSNLVVNIVKDSTTTQMQILYPDNNTIQYFKITDSTCESTNVCLNDLATVSYIEEYVDNSFPTDEETLQELINADVISAVTINGEILTDEQNNILMM